MKKSNIWLSAMVVSMGCVTAHASLLTGVNVLGNSGFEDATIAPWAAQNGAPSLSLSSVAQTGLQSAQVDFTADFHGIQQTLALDAGDALQEYTLTASVNRDGYTDPLIVRLGLWEFTPSSGITFNDKAWVNVPAGNGWVELDYTVTLSAPTANALRSVVQIAPQGNPKLPGHFLVDDVSLVKSIPEPGTLTLLGAMGGALLFIRRRFKI